MKRRWLDAVGVATLAVAVAASRLAACGGDDDDAADTTGGDGGSDDITAVVEQLGGPIDLRRARPGGTYRIANTDFAQSDGFDPTGEYFGSAWTIYNSLMLRTLVSYPFTAGPAGNELVPDLATEIPEPTEDGLTYTFTLKDGRQVRPAGEPRGHVEGHRVRVRAHRHARASPRSTASTTASIKGFAGVRGGQGRRRSRASQTPDDKTIIFTLTAPTGDFLYRLAMPATAPIPRGGGASATPRPASTAASSSRPART